MLHVFPKKSGTLKEGNISPRLLEQGVQKKKIRFQGNGKAFRQHQGGSCIGGSYLPVCLRQVETPCASQEELLISLLNPLRIQVQRQKLIKICPYASLYAVSDPNELMHCAQYFRQSNCLQLSCQKNYDSRLVLWEEDETI